MTTVIEQVRHKAFVASLLVDGEPSIASGDTEASAAEIALNLAEQLRDSAASEIRIEVMVR